ncbi:RNA replicase, partial [Mycobacterium timonense]
MSYQDSSHGSAYPRHRLGTARNRDLRIGSAPSPLGRAAGDYAEHCQSTAVQQRLRRIRNREQRRNWVQRAGETAPSTPMWTSRAGWIGGVEAWAQSNELEA